jgi:predicted ATPase with chaperone activity
MDDIDRFCTCTLEEIIAWRETRNYQEALQSDIFVDVLNPKPSEHFAWREPYTQVKERIQRVRENQVFQRASFRNPDQRKMQGILDYLSKAKDVFGLTQTQIQSTGRVAQTIADMDGQEYVSITHVAEAVGYKSPLLPNN